MVRIEHIFSKNTGIIRIETTEDIYANIPVQDLKNIKVVNHDSEGSERAVDLLVSGNKVQTFVLEKGEVFPYHELESVISFAKKTTSGFFGKHAKTMLGVFSGALATFMLLIAAPATFAYLNQSSMSQTNPVSLSTPTEQQCTANGGYCVAEDNPAHNAISPPYLPFKEDKTEEWKP